MEDAREALLAEFFYSLVELAICQTIDDVVQSVRWDRHGGRFKGYGERSSWEGDSNCEAKNGFASQLPRWAT